MQAQCCPVCNGTGEKTVGLYSQASIRDGTPTRCRSCDGKGYVLVPSESIRLPMMVNPPATPQRPRYDDDPVRQHIEPPSPYQQPENESFEITSPPRRIEPTTVDTAGTVTGTNDVAVS